MESADKILIVDDDPIIGKMYRTVFEGAGFDVSIAEDGAQAKAHLRNSRPDVVLLDIFLPRTNGVELLKHIRSRRSTFDIPVIMFSTSSTTRYLEAAWAAGATKCLAKDDFDPFRVLNVVRGVLAEHRANPERKISDGPTGGVRPEIRNGSLQSTWPVMRYCQIEEEREIYLDTVAALRNELRIAWHNLSGAKPDHCYLVKLSGFQEAIGTIGRHARNAELPQLALLCRLVEQLTAELQRKVQGATSSVLRTLADAVEFLMLLTRQDLDVLAATVHPKLMLNISKQAYSGDMLACLRDAQFCVVHCNDLTVGARILQHNRCDVILIDPDTAKLSPPEYCAKIRALRFHATTPLVMCISAEEFESRVSAEQHSWNEWIVNPFLSHELVLKTFVLAGRRRCALPRGSGFAV